MRRIYLQIITVGITLLSTSLSSLAFAHGNYQLPITENINTPASIISQPHKLIQKPNYISFFSPSSNIHQKSLVPTGTVIYQQTMPLLTVFAISYFLMLPVTWLILLFVRPLWLFKLDILLKPLDFAIPCANRYLLISPRQLLLVRFFARYPQVIDAWINQHLDIVAQEFIQLETVRDRKFIHSPVPVVLDGVSLPGLTPNNIATTFRKPSNRLLIFAEQNAIATSLAIQIGFWAMGKETNQNICDRPMLPVLIEDDLDSRNPLALLSEIRTQLHKLTRTSEPIADDLLYYLLRQRRILLIVNHFSHLSAKTQFQILNAVCKFPINTLIVVSHKEASLTKFATNSLYISDTHCRLSRENNNANTN